MKEKHGWFDERKNIVRFLQGFFVFLGLLIVIDFFIPKHADFYWEETPAFFAAFGYISCVALIYVARGIRILIKRDEDYYDR